MNLMNIWRNLTSLSIILAVGASLAAAAILPGLQPDGSVLLHNQWPIKPAGSQLTLGEFPVSIALDPSGHYAAVLHAGQGKHAIWLIDVASQKTIQVVNIVEAFNGLAFSSDGQLLACSGGSEQVIRLFSFSNGTLHDHKAVIIGKSKDRAVVTGVTFKPYSHIALAARLLENDVHCVDCDTGLTLWVTRLGDSLDGNKNAPAREPKETIAPNDILGGTQIIEGEQPLDIIYDDRAAKIYVSLWGQSAIAVLSALDGHQITRFACGLHPNAMQLSPKNSFFDSGKRLYVSNGGLNTVSVLDTTDGHILEQLNSSIIAGATPGSTPDSLALSQDGKRLYVANSNNNNIAVFDVTTAGTSTPIGFIPTGWMPTSVRLTANEDRLLVLSSRGLTPKANNIGKSKKFQYIGALFDGSLASIDLSKGDAGIHQLESWTKTALTCVPARGNTPDVGILALQATQQKPSPITHVIYVIKENRTYDQVFGDIEKGNGDANLCLFPESVTPNHHALAKQFILLDNFYANSEVSASGHEWSMAGYCSEFVEKIWPPDYGHRPQVTGLAQENFPYPSEGHYAAAFPALGYIWDQAAKANVSYRTYGEFIVNGATAKDPAIAIMPSLKGHLDPNYRGFDLSYSEQKRATEFISEMKRYETLEDMPHLQIVRFGNDHTMGAKAHEHTPRAMVADNDLALGRLIEALSHSRFWANTLVLVVEDDSQNGPDHVDAHRTVALAISPYTQKAAVDSTPYTTCSMLHTMELILGIEPMSQFDASAQPMWASFQAVPNLSTYTALTPNVNLDETNPVGTRGDKVSSTFDFSKEDRIDEIAFNRVIWATVKGEKSTMPAPVHAAFVRSLKHHSNTDADADDD